MTTLFVAQYGDYGTGPGVQFSGACSRHARKVRALVERDVREVTWLGIAAIKPDEVPEVLAWFHERSGLCGTHKLALVLPPSDGAIGRSSSHPPSAPAAERGSGGGAGPSGAAEGGRWYTEAEVARNDDEQRFIARLEAQAPEGFDVWTFFPQLVTTVVVGENNHVERTLRVDYDGRSIRGGNDPTHQITRPDLDSDDPDLFERRDASSPEEFADLANEWFWRQVRSFEASTGGGGDTVR